MNILLINHYSGSNTHGMEYRPFYLAREWVRQGHKVTILASSYSHLRRTNPVVNGNIKSELIDDIRYVWIKTPPYTGNGLSRVVNIFTFVSKLYSVKEEDIAFTPDVIITSSTYPFDIYPARKLQKKYGCKLIYEVHDLWPLTLIELGGMSKYHPFIMLMQQAENHSYKVSDQVVSLLPKAYEYMEQHGMQRSKFVFIPNGIVLEEWGSNITQLPKEHADLIGKLKRDGHFLIAYTGSHGITDTLDTLIDAASLVKDKLISFLLIGSGPEKERLIAKAGKMKLENIHFLSPVMKSSIPTLLNEADALYIGCEKKDIYKYGICPNKLFDYMMSARPVISAVEAGNDIVGESSCGKSVPAGTPESISEAIKALHAMSTENLYQMGMRGKEYVLKNHDYSTLAKQFIDSIKEIG